MKGEYKGDILSVRAVEDCIRATRKYTKGAFSKAAKHPMQGEDFPSRVLTEYYEVYPDTEVSWEMSASTAWAWVWGDVIHIDVRFAYDYRANKARVTVYGGEEAVRELSSGIPEFSDALALVGGQAPATQVGEPVADAIIVKREVVEDAQPVAQQPSRAQPSRQQTSGRRKRTGAAKC